TTKGRGCQGNGLVAGIIPDPPHVQQVGAPMCSVEVISV
ncbi:hypothetical protein TNIN_45641, partial [Trichonephila inaurata madagascariensis]